MDINQYPPQYTDNISQLKWKIISAFDSYPVVFNAICIVSGHTSADLSDLETMLNEIKNKHLSEVNQDIASQKDKDGVGLAFIAAQHGHAEILEKLIEAGADVNQAMNNGATPTFIATNLAIRRFLRNS